jgi:hypothetical protein
MEPEKFKQLIYAKGFDTELTQRLLKIADSSMVMEDLLELIDEEKTLLEEDDDDEICDVNSCDTLLEAESERDEAKKERNVAEVERDTAQKELIDLKKNLSDLIVKPNVGVGTVIPQSLVHVKCECGNELFIDGKQEGWRVDFQGPVVFKCPCGKNRIVSIDTTSLTTLCTACKAFDKNNPPCGLCDRLICPECEADNTDNPPCSTCERNRPHA